MTYTPIDDFTPAQRVGAALYKVVNDSFYAGLKPEDEHWLLANKAKAAKLYRYHNALAWFWADQFVQRHNISSPPPNEFMQFFRESVFSSLLTFFPGMAERDGGKLLWAMLYDDDEKTPDLINEVAATKPPYMNHAIGKEWMAAQGIDIDGPQRDMWLRSILIAGDINTQVKAVLSV